VTLAERLARLGEILVALSGSPIPTHLFQTLADRALDAIAADYFAVCLQDEDGKGYRVHGLAGPGVEVSARRFAREEGLVGRVLHGGRVHVVHDLAAETSSAPDLEGALVAAGLQSALVVAVRRGLDPIGALLFARRGARGFDGDDLEVAGLLAAGVGSALEASRLYQALADERSTLGALLGSTADAVLMVNDDGLVVLANPAVRPMLGLAPDALLGRPCAEVLAHAPLRALLRAGRPGTAEVALPDGRIAQASLVPVATPYGEPIGLAAVLRDITVLKQLDQMKNDFVNTVSHDLKSPITAIGLTADLLRGSKPGDTRFRDRCERIIEMADHMRELVGDLLDLGKIEAGLEPPDEAIDLVPLLHEVGRLVAPQAEAKQIALGIEGPGAAPVLAARSRLRQALLNLVGNAVKYTPAGGRVDVRAELVPGSPAAPGEPGAGGRVHLRVTDTGIGIPARDLPHVFDKFYRVKSEATSEIAGTGLGLAITRSIVEVHQGRLWVESVEGSGSTFHLELPLSGEVPPGPAT
jgi:PAS domain S-box-containing protein